MIQWKEMPRQRVLWAVVALLVLCCAAVAAVAGTLYYRSADQIDLTIDLIPEEGYLVQRFVPLDPARARTVALGAPSAGEGWTAMPSMMAGENYSFPLYVQDEYDQVWGSDTQVEIFKTSYANDAQEITVAGKNGDNLIAPGTENDYIFALYNNIGKFIDYKLEVSTAVTGVDGITEFPVELRIRGLNGWVVGDENTWVPALEVSGVQDTGVSSERLSAIYTLEWRWPFEGGQDELDTWLGSQTEDVIFSIKLQTTAVFHPEDDDDEGDVDIDGPTGEGGGSSGEIPQPPQPPVVPPITEPVPEDLRQENHFHEHPAYIYGYEDGTLRPEANITRAEVAAIFYRLVREDVRQQHYTLACDYPDVPMDSWFRAEVATMTNMGIVEGYPDGTFRPDEPVTRAELTAIVSRFAVKSWAAGGKSLFTDIQGHWANDEIRSVEDKNWIIGYPDGTFRPDASITRGETVTIVNRVLHRLPEQFEDLLEEMPTWRDNEDMYKWYYIAMQEAAVSHRCEYLVGTREQWTELIEDVPQHP